MPPVKWARNGIAEGASRAPGLYAQLVLSPHPRIVAILVMLVITFVYSGGAHAEDAPKEVKVAIAYPATEHGTPLTGRLFFMVGHTNTPELRLQSYWFNSPEFVGTDVTNWEPARDVVLDGKTLGYPFRSLNDLPDGDYMVQAVFCPYVSYRRSDGHTIWAPDQWTGHAFANSTGTLYSDVQPLHLSRSPITVQVSLTHKVPQAPEPHDTEWVKHIKMRSRLLSNFWGRPIYLGAVILLPRTYASSPQRHYPVIYQQQAHFNSLAPFDFMIEDRPEGEERYRRECRGACETGYKFQQSWLSEDFPQVIAVAIQHPTPYADYSAAINSANNGPYGDAIVKELIPYIESQFRTIAAPPARAIVGKSLGGRDALALQLFYPDFFGGAWIFYPWGISFSEYATLNIYEHHNAFEISVPDGPAWYGFWSKPEWAPLERVLGRAANGQPLMTFRQLSQHDAVVEPRTGGETGGEDAIFGPVGADGYPVPLWNRLTGQIDHHVAEYWRGHGDLIAYAEREWPMLGQKLKGKLHFYAGDADEYFRHFAVHELDQFLKQNAPAGFASFEYAAQAGHGWQPMSNADLVRIIAKTTADAGPVRSDSRVEEGDR